MAGNVIFVYYNQVASNPSSGLIAAALLHIHAVHRERDTAERAWRHQPCGRRAAMGAGCRGPWGCGAGMFVVLGGPGDVVQVCLMC